MKQIVRSVIKLDDGSSVFSGLKYYKKLGKDIQKVGKIDLSIVNPEFNTLTKLGDINNIQIIEFTKTKLLFEMQVKTSFDLNLEGRQIRFGALFNKTDKEQVKFKDIKHPFFYIIDSEKENLLLKAKSLNLLITDKSGNSITNSRLNLTEVFS